MKFSKFESQSIFEGIHKFASIFKSYSARHICVIFQLSSPAWSGITLAVSTCDSAKIRNNLDQVETPTGTQGRLIVVTKCAGEAASLPHSPP
jgi:hypothetical protein